MTETAKYDYVLHADAKNAKGTVVGLVGHGKSVLEIGCATGSMTRCLAEELGCTVTALELNRDDAALAARFCRELHVGDVEAVNLDALVGGQRFNVVTFADVLEHLRDPVSALRKARAVLMPEGFIVVSVPNIAHASIAFELSRGRFDYQRVGLLDETHIRFFTKLSLLRTLEAAGFAVVCLERFVVEPRFTEFRTAPESEAEKWLLKRLTEAHPESTTYQFIAKAIPLDRELGGVASATAAMEETVSRLERSLGEEIDRRKKAEAELAWLATRWPLNWVQRLRRPPDG